MNTLAYLAALVVGHEASYSHPVPTQPCAQSAAGHLPSCCCQQRLPRTLRQSHQRLGGSLAAAVPSDDAAAAAARSPSWIRTLEKATAAADEIPAADAAIRRCVGPGRGGGCRKGERVLMAGVLMLW